MPNPNLTIALKFGSLDFFQDLVEPLAQHNSPFEPLTREEFPTEDNNAIKQFCKTWQKKIADFESKLPAGEIADFNLDVDYDLVLDEGNKYPSLNS